MARGIWIALCVSLLATSAHGFRRAWRAGRSVVPELRARQLSARAYDDGFVTTLGSNLGLQAATVTTLRDGRVPELVLMALSRDELREHYNISLVDAVLIEDWTTTVKDARRKDEDAVERARLEEEETAKRARLEEEETAKRARLEEEETAKRARLEEEETAKRARRKDEDAVERARFRQLKFDQAKLVRIFNEDSRKYADYYFPDQSSLQMFFSNQRIAGLAVVDANSSSSLVVTDWERLVNGSYYSGSLKKMQDAVEVLKSDLMNAEKSAAEYGCSRLLAVYFHTEFHYIASDIKMTDKRGKSLGDIDTLFVSDDRSRVVLLERKSSLSANATSISALIGQIHATKEAFLDPDTLFSVPILGGETYMADASVVNAVYCKAGPASLFRDLTADGIHVVTDAIEHLAPTHL
jgi:hypothetical protein